MDLPFAARVRTLFAILVCLGGLAASPSFVATARANPELLVDMVTGDVLHADDAGQRWHPASLTKLMTAYVAFHAIAEGRVGLDTRVTVSRQAWNQAPAKSGLPIGSTLSMKDALYVMLVKSANDIAWAIGETVGGGSIKPFIAEMNATADRLGMTGTHYDNPNGLPDPGQITTARDLAILAMHIHLDYPAYLPIFETQKVKLGKRTLESENDLLTKFEGTTGMKTGYICDSGLNIVATVVRNGRQLLAVILGGQSSRERGEMTAELFLRALAGSYTSTGRNIMDLPNDPSEPVGNMRSKICGKQAKAYRAERMKAYPLGLKGQPSYLTDKIPPIVYVTQTVNEVGDVPLPRPRPDDGPSAAPLAMSASSGPGYGTGLGAITPRPMGQPATAR